MNQFEMIFALVFGALVIGMSYAWWKYARRTKRIRTAVGNVLGEFPHYMQTVNDLDRYARALLGELTQDSITFTVVRDRKGVFVA